MFDAGPGMQAGNALVDPVVPELDPDIVPPELDPLVPPVLVPLVAPVLVPVLPAELPAPVVTKPAPVTLSVLDVKQQPPRARSAARKPTFLPTMSRSGPQVGDRDNRPRPRSRQSNATSNIERDLEHRMRPRTRTRSSNPHPVLFSMPAPPSSVR